MNPGAWESIIVPPAIRLIDGFSGPHCQKKPKEKNMHHHSSSSGLGRKTTRRSFAKAAVLAPVVGVLSATALSAQPLLAHAQTPHFGLAGAQSVTAESWSLTSPLPVAQWAHTETLLTNGRMLVAGGNTFSSTLATAYVYDPATATWTQTGSMQTTRSKHTATLLLNGKMLAVGGGSTSTSSGITASAEFYDSATSTWTPTGSMQMNRYSHTATLLPNGKVLVTGGISSGASGRISSTAELYDPATGTWTPTGFMSTPRYDHTATLLPNGKVLLAGGWSTFTQQYETLAAELYDPATGTWTLTGSPQMPRLDHTATLLPNGKVLLAGGDTSRASVSAELYDPATGTWAPNGSLDTFFVGPTATLLPNGKVLVAGGGDGSGGNNSSLATAYLYDPATGTWTLTGSLNTPRQLHTAALLPNGQVLVVAGWGGSENANLASAELFTPPTIPIQGNYQGNGIELLNRHPHSFTMQVTQSDQNLTGTVTVAGGTPTPFNATLTGASFQGQVTFPTASTFFRGTVVGVNPVQLSCTAGGVLGVNGPVTFLVTQI